MLPMAMKKTKITCRNFGEETYQSNPSDTFQLYWFWGIRLSMPVLALLCWLGMSCLAHLPPCPTCMGICCSLVAKSDTSARYGVCKILMVTSITQYMGTAKAILGRIRKLPSDFALQLSFFFRNPTARLGADAILISAYFCWNLEHLAG